MIAARFMCVAAVIAVLIAMPQAALFAQDKEIEQGAEREVQEALEGGKEFAHEESAGAGPSSSEGDLMKAKELDRAGVIREEEKDVEEESTYRNYPWEE